MENGPFEEVFPIERGDIPASYVSLPEGNCVGNGTNADHMVVNPLIIMD